MRELLVGAAVLLPALARAHAGGSESALVAGLMHPVFGLDHLMAMVSVGIVSALLGGASAWRIPIAFVCAMAAGGVPGVLRLTLPGPELAIAASVLALGTAIVVAHPRMSPWPISGIVLIFGAYHGYAHGLEIPLAASPALYTLGFVISTSVLHVLGLVIGAVAMMQASLWKGLRVAGVALAASGVVLLLAP